MRALDDERATLRAVRILKEIRALKLNTIKENHIEKRYDIILSPNERG